MLTSGASTPRRYGDGRVSSILLVAAIEETNALAPDLVAVAADLTTEGYRHKFEEVRGYLDGLECPNVVVVMGNHDARNVGYRHSSRTMRTPVTPIPDWRGR
jgi:3',5'-cyclic-AMP phosphodiesterase